MGSLGFGLLAKRRGSPLHFFEPLFSLPSPSSPLGPRRLQCWTFGCGPPICLGGSLDDFSLCWNWVSSVALCSSARTPPSTPPPFRAVPHSAVHFSAQHSHWVLCIHIPSPGLPFPCVSDEFVLVHWRVLSGLWYSLSGGADVPVTPLLVAPGCLFSFSLRSFRVWR